MRTNLLPVHPKKKILLVAEYAPTGGALRYTEQLITHLLAQGFEIHFLPLGPEVPTLTDFHSQKGFKALELPAKRFPEFIAWNFLRRNPLAYLRETQRIRRALVVDGGYDLCISSVCSPGRLLGLATREIRHVQIIHTYPRGWRHRIAGPLFGLMSRGDTLVAVSQYLADRLRSFWDLSPKHEVTVVPNSQGRPPRQSPDFSQRNPIVVSFGAVNDEKNPTALLELASAVRKTLPHASADWRFYWFGDGPLLEIMRQRVEADGLESFVFFTGHTVKTDEWYARARVFFHPSHVDSMPLAAIDALRWGLPSLLSGSGGLPEVLGPDAQEFIINPTSPEGFLPELQLLMTDERTWSDASSAMLERYEQCFSRDIWEDSMNRVINGSLR